MDGTHPNPLSFVAPELRFGEGVVRELPDVLDRLGVDSPLVVTDTGVRDAGVLAEATAGLDGHESVDATTEPSTGDFDSLPAAESTASWPSAAAPPWTTRRSSRSSSPTAATRASTSGPGSSPARSPRSSPSRRPAAPDRR